MNISVNSARLASDASPFDALANLLASHPFADNGYITKQMHARLRTRLSKITPTMPSAGQLLAALEGANAYAVYRTLGDTAVRCAIQRILTLQETGAERGLPAAQCDEIFQAAAARLEHGTVPPPGQPDNIGREVFHGRVWRDTGDCFSRAVSDIVRTHYDAPLHSADDEDIAKLRRGTELLEHLWPQARDALSHAHVIALFPHQGRLATTASSSTFHVGGTVLLYRDAIDNPWWVAEHLFHEALHHQMYDFRHCHTLLQPDYDRPHAPRIHSLWNVPPGNQWDTHRGLAAFHVYTFLAIFSSVAEQHARDLEPTFGPGHVAISGRRRALDRAHYLAERLRDTGWNELGDAGKRFVTFFEDVLDAVGGELSPPGAGSHLLMDRYRREVAIVRAHLDRGRDDLRPTLAALVDGEAIVARDIVGSAESATALEKLPTLLAAKGAGTSFADARKLIADAISACFIDAFRLSEKGDVDEMLRTMIEDSSERLRIAIGG